MGPCFLNADFAFANAFSGETICFFSHIPCKTTPATRPEPAPMRNVFQFMNEPPLGKITIDPFTILSEMKWILKLFSPIETHTLMEFLYI